jgi:hypothetical protein
LRRPIADGRIQLSIRWFPATGEPLLFGDCVGHPYRWNRTDRVGRRTNYGFILSTSLGALKVPLLALRRTC